MQYTIVSVNAATSTFPSAPSDYTDTAMQLTFTENGVQFVDIPITDDSNPESMEFFTVSLAVDSHPQNVVVLQPTSTGRVSITDSDGKMLTIELAVVRLINTVLLADEARIRFIPTLYTVNEEDMTARVFIELSGMEITGSVVVNVSTGSAGDSAVGKLYCF